MPEMTPDSEARDLVADTKRVLERLGPAAVLEVQEGLSVPVEHIGSETIRSKPGEQPRMETGTLRASMRWRVEVEGDRVSLDIFTDCTYAGFLNDKLDRPIISDEMNEEWDERLLIALTPDRYL